MPQSLCRSCQRLRLQRLPDFRNGECAWYHSSLEQFRKQALSCSACNLIRSSFRATRTWHRDADVGQLSTGELFERYFDRELEAEASTQRYTHCIVFSRDISGTAVREKPLRCIRVFLVRRDRCRSGTLSSRKGRYRRTVVSTQIRLYAVSGSPAALSGSFVSSFAADYLAGGVSASGETAGAYVRRWLDYCLRNHSDCRRSLAGNPLDPALLDTWPSRLLRISVLRSEPGSQSSRLVLVETQGKYLGQYAALSHCWGPLEKRPTRTTTANHNQLKTGIPLEDLPRTFHDAVTVCKAIGLSYLWIDSLCIIQDDPKDWEKESMIMGQIYEQALITIAATSAHDSTEGLFKVRKPIKLGKFPFYPDASRHQDGFVSCVDMFETFLSWEDIQKQPLGRRGWVMQEFLLSRRTTHFTARGMAFTCSGEGLGDNFRTEFRDAPYDPPIDSWQEVWREYVTRDLTYQTDKLAAVQGIASTIARRDNVTYYFGIFLEYFPIGLVWVPTETWRLKPITGASIPSWSWASREGRIVLPRSLMEDDKVPDEWEHKSVCQLTQTSPDKAPGALELSATIRKIEVGRHPYYCRGLDPEIMTHEELREAWDTCPTAQQNTTLDDMRCSCPRPDANSPQHNGSHEGIFAIASKEEAVTIGWARFDGGEKVDGSLFFLAVYQADSVHLINEYRASWRPRASSNEPFRWWGLIVRLGAVDGTFQRVGYGEVLKQSRADIQTRETVFLA